MKASVGRGMKRRDVLPCNVRRSQTLPVFRISLHVEENRGVPAKRRSSASGRPIADLCVDMVSIGAFVEDMRNVVSAGRALRGIANVFFFPRIVMSRHNTRNAGDNAKQERDPRWERKGKRKRRSRRTAEEKYDPTVTGRQRERDGTGT